MWKKSSTTINQNTLCFCREHATSLCHNVLRLLKQYLDAPLIFKEWIDFRLEGEDPRISGALDFKEAYYHVNWGLLTLWESWSLLWERRILPPKWRAWSTFSCFSQVLGADKWLTRGWEIETSKRDPDLASRSQTAEDYLKRSRGRSAIISQPCPDCSKQGGFSSLHLFRNCRWNQL